MEYFAIFDLGAKYIANRKRGNLKSYVYKCDTLLSVRIVFTRFPLESRYGGAEVQTMALMRGLRQRSHAVAFLGSCPTLLQLCGEEGILAAELMIGDPPVTEWKAASFLWRRVAMKRKLESALAEFGPLDALVMLSMTEKILLTPIAHERGIRVLWVEHDRVGRWLRWNPWLSSMRRASVGATVVTVSELSRKIYVEELNFPPAQIAVIGNGIDPAHLESDTTMDRPMGSSLHIGTVARLSHDKGVDLLIEAVADLPGVTLSILATGGKGKEEPRLRALADRINRTEQRIRFLPPTTAVGGFYRSLDVFVLPSREHDPCPLAPMEALWTGTPVILTDVCGTAGYVRHGEEGIVVPAGSVAALHDALQTMQNPAQRRSFADRGRHAAHERFSLETMMNAYETLLNSPA